MTDHHDFLPVKNADEFGRMPEEYRELAIRQMIIHAAGELSGADDYVSVFYRLAPDAEEQRACCIFAVDEMNHYIRTATVLQEVGVDISYLLKKTVDERKEYPSELVRGVRSWADRAMASFIGEAAVNEILKDLATSSYRPFADLFPLIIDEEEVHIEHGRRIVERMCATDEGRAEIQASLDRFWPIGLDLFGSATSERAKRFAKWKLRSLTNEETRQRFIDSYTPRIEALGLRVPDASSGRTIY